MAELPMARHASAGPQGKGTLAGKQLESFLSASLTEDLAALKNMASVERKSEHKRDTLLPKYAPYVERLKESDTGHDLLGYYLVWLFDAGSIDEATQFAGWCLEHGVALPARFQSDIRFFIASQVTEWAEKEEAAGREAQPYFDLIWKQALAEMETWNLPDDLNARYFRLKGLVAERLGDLVSAEKHLLTALDLGAKVKTALERVQKKIKPQEGGDSGESGPGRTPEEAAGA
jgi:hypothetical protein